MPERVCPNCHVIPDTDEFCHACGRLPISETPEEWNARHPNQQLPTGIVPGRMDSLLDWLGGHPSVLGLLLVIILAGGMASFMAFVQDSERLGGDALNGYEQQGHYYVSGHGDYIEVSKADWDANRLRGMLGLSGWAVAFVIMGYLAIRRQVGRWRSTFSLREDVPVPSDDPVAYWLTTSPLMDKIMAVPPDTEPVVEEDLTGHRLLASMKGTWGVVRRRIPKPWFSAEVYSDEIVLSAGKLGTLTLSPYHVSLVTYKRKGPEQGVKITHSSKEIVSPIFIGGVEEDSPFGQALNKVVGSAKVE